MRYMTREELAELLRSDKVAEKDYVVIDVRDEDRVGGHIIGSINEPSADFLMNVEGLVRKNKDVPLIIFHCALSQMRGPKAARMYQETRDIFVRGNEPPQDIAILRDGFIGFQEKYKDDPKLIEQWDREVWDLEALEASGLVSTVQPKSGS